RRLHGLSQIVEGAKLHSVDTVVVVRLPRENHDFAWKTGLAETSKQFKPAKTGHAEIEKHHVEGALRDAVQGHFTTRGRVHDVAGPSETVVYDEAEGVVIVDNEDAHQSAEWRT